MFDRIGKKILLSLSTLIEMSDMLRRAFSEAGPVLTGRARPARRVFFKQIYFTGLQALAIVIVIAVLIGAVIVSQVMSFASSGSSSLEGSGSIAGKILVWVVVREIAPLLTALIVIARSGNAIATELGQMKLGGEIQLLRSMGISPDQYLVAPRIFGVTVAVAILSVYFASATVAGGFLTASAIWHIPFEQILHGLASTIRLADIFQLFFKSSALGMTISLICCRKGLLVSRSATQIPQAATGAVIQSLFAVFFIDGVLTFIFH